MRIAIPVDEKSLETSVCVSFGRASYFLIYDTDSREKVFVDNSAAYSQGGAGIKAAQYIADSGVSALLTPRCGENAAEVIEAAKIKIYKTINDSISDNINAFNEGKLAMLKEIHAGFHGHGGK
ncbi:MAG: NifB/NifX family molybdenum-iron cluster-binding protein [Syntrophomonas sp.]|nr:NifB/NifX family molybdenum-iron cluster-binding protein [Syntrophomonas sp.]